jgi:hypothetical protein
MKFVTNLRLTVTALFVFALSGVKADDNSILYKETARAQNQSLLWGPYCPNLYFGVRPRIPKSLVGGLMWAKVEDFQNVQHSMSPAHLPASKGYGGQLKLGCWFCRC